MVGPAARLEIDFYSDLARLQGDMDMVKRAVGGMVGGVSTSLTAGARGLDAFQNRFGELGKMAETSAQRAERAFEESFREINRLAGNALKLSANDNGGANLGAAEARAAAAAAREQAASLALVEQAAQRAAAGEGDLTERTRIYLQAANAARIEAERNAVELGQQAEAVERLEAEYNQLRGTTVGAANAGRQITVSAGAQRAGMQQLSFQLGDSVTQWAGGTRAMTIFAQQAGQTAMAVGLMTGESKGLIGFIGGPWGQVIIAGATILGVLASNLLDNKKAAEAAAKAMQDFQHRQSDIANFIDTTTGALKEQNKTLVLNAILTRQANIAANEKEISDSRRSMLDMARRQAQFGKIGTSGTMQGTDPLVVAAGDPDVARLLKQYAGNLAKVQEEVAKLATTRRPDLAKFALDLTNIGGAAVTAQREIERDNREISALSGNTRALANSTTALIERQVASATATTGVEKAQARLNDVRSRAQAIDAMQAGAGKDKALSQYRDDLMSATNALNAAQAAAAHHSNAAERHAHALAVDANAVDAAVKGLWDLADAYEKGDSAAMRAEAQARANEKAIRKEGDAGLMYNQELAKAVAGRAQQTGKMISGLDEETAAQVEANRMVQEGLLTSEQAQEYMRKEAALRPVLAAMENAHGAALSKLHEPI
jgi:hypothetical protein